MNKKQRITAVAGVVLAAVAAAGGVAVATGDDGDVTVQGPEADRATEAALAATGGGTANSVERDSENGATWEVEVTREDGTTVDVRLDENYGVVVIEGDGDESGD
ncbi:MAG: PepSY domain-containing protein [Nocardioides sp.]